MPRLRPGIDLTKVGLSAEEGYLATRIDGRTTISDLAHILGKTKKEIELIVSRLAKAGVVQLGSAEEKPKERDRGTEPPKAPPAAAPAAADAPAGGGDAYEGFVFPAGLMNEECDLEPEERKRIIWFHHHLETWTHYEILQTKRKDDAKEIKKAYFMRSKEWHPDRFRRPNLGSFKRLIDDIYKQVKDAHEVLSDPDKRAAYDETMVFVPEADEIAEMLDKQRRLDREKLREEEAVERRRRRNPMRVRIEKARAIFEQSIEKEKAGDLLNALRLAQTAATFDDRAEYKEAIERLKVESGEHRIGPYMKRGLAQESMTRWEGAIQTFRDAVRVAPEHGPAHLRLAYNLVMGGVDPHEANTHAQKAVSLLPDDPEAHFVLGMCYEKGGMDKAAVRAYSRALELKPNFVEVKKRLKKLKWGF